MTIATWIEVIGSVAGLCTTFAFVPQVLKIWKQGGRDLSYSMLGLYLTGVLLWLTYGLLLHAWAIIWANAATALLIVMATTLKAWKEKQAALEVPLADQTAERS
jgi:MtN3 and saliva related transmembrane protein